MLKICTNCYYVGIGVHEDKCNWVAGFVIIFIALCPMIVLRHSFILMALYFIFGGALAFLGFKYSIVPCYRKEGDLCAKCKKSNFLIPIDSPKAQALIKEHTITIPEEPVEPPAESPKPKLPWQVG